MGLQLPTPPEGHGITFDEADGRYPRVSWLPPDADPSGRWGAAGFLMVWLCGWAAGEILVPVALVNQVYLLCSGEHWEGPDPSWWLVLFLSGWLACWTYGGIMAIRTVADILRPARPERLTFMEDALHYDPGRHWSHSQSDGIGARRQPVILPREQISAVRLELVGTRQRLTIDHGIHRVELGARLREPEREWLASVLQRWAGQTGD